VPQAAGNATRSDSDEKPNFGALMLAKMLHIVGLYKAVGLAKATNIIFRRFLNINCPIRISLRDYSFVLRPTDSDLFVASQIFGHAEYDVGEKMKDAISKTAYEWIKNGITPIIIDAGANVGYSSIFFARSFPMAQVIAIEPDVKSYQILNINCCDLKRIISINAALWSHGNGVRLIDGDKGSWSNSVLDNGTTPSIQLERALALVSNARPLIIKLDIEGAEREVIEASAETIKSAPCLLIEPHDFMLPGAGCLSPLFNAIAGKKVDVLLKGENLMIFDSNLVFQACSM
jgi:FkbM family methyltransferase